VHQIHQNVTSGQKKSVVSSVTILLAQTWKWGCSYAYAN